ncbi:NADPH-ferrihemoprotein reductase [Diaporthe eres]|uniref:Protein kinase domain-containing protein n=1 Tax=Diaporthe vaccinii TaxID=105482 RepID=A0ABR4DST2_9PEZI|nr:NADPH-ferrihemoprotein reductase [Diaporthe eres]
MRLSDREAAPAIRARLEPLGRTALSIVYAEKSNPKYALKAAGFWLDGEMYDHAAFAEDTSNMLKREAAVYEALGSHPRILECMGVELMPDGEEAWALRLERAPHGNLREYIGKNEPPTMARRVQVAINFAETLQHIHDRGVIWGDLSARNVLVFDDLHIKLCDFAGSSLKDIFPELDFEYEPRYWAPGPEEDSPARGTLAAELFALGTAICEITEWTLPYGPVEEEEILQKLSDGEYPHLTENNPVRGIIQKLWHFEYNCAQEVVEALKTASD